MKVLVSGIVEKEEDWTLLLKRVTELQASKNGPFDVLLVLPGSVPTFLEFPLPLVYEKSQRVLDQMDVVISSSDPLVTIPHQPCDILLSQFLPGDGCGVPNALKTDRLAVEWALNTTPKYHFCGGAMGFFQRAPYRNKSNHVITRLIALCPVGSKEKWIHAINLVQNPPSVEPPGTTSCPYDTLKAASSLTTTTNANPFFFAPTSDHTRNNNNNNNTNKRMRNAPAAKFPTRADCWFCLASPSCEQHLIVHVGEEAYLALPKGGISPLHVLLIPIAHERTFGAMVEKKHLEEVVSLLTKLETLFAQSGMGMLLADRSVTFSQAAQQHAYLEILPIPLAELHRVQHVFDQEVHDSHISFEGLREEGLSQQLQVLSTFNNTGGYFFIRLPNGKAFLHRDEDSSSNNNKEDDFKTRNSLLQFARKLGVSLCGLPENHVHWKSVVKPKAEEQSMAKSFAKQWKLL